MPKIEFIAIVDEDVFEELCSYPSHRVCVISADDVDDALFDYYSEKEKAFEQACFSEEES